MAEKKKKSKMKAILIVTAIILILFIAFVVWVGQSMSSNSLFTEETATRRDITTFYTFTGIVEADNSTAVVAETTNEVLEVKVKEGDSVKAGDVIAVLDSSDIERSIKMKETAMSSSDVSDTYSLNSARKSYEDFKDGIDNGTNSQLNSAQSAVDSAKINLDNAKKNYEEARKELDGNNDSTLVSARKSVENAERDLADAKKNYEEHLKEMKEEDYESIKTLKDAVDEAKDNYDYLMLGGYDAEVKAAAAAVADAKAKYDALNSEFDPDLQAIAAAKTEIETAQAAYEKLAASIKTADEMKKIWKDAEKDYNEAKEEIDEKYSDTLESLERAVDNAENVLDSAERNLADTEKRLDDSVESYFDSYENAKRNYDEAVKNLESTKISIEQTLDSYKTSYDRTSELMSYSTDTLELDNLYEQLEACTITAKSDGIISELAVKEGAYAAANQTVAVVTDYSSLVIDIKIDEYDILKVSEGDKVEVYVNALEETVTGTITKISSKAEVSSGVSYFPAEVTIDAGENIRVGMSVEVKLISRYSENAVSIVVEAVQYNDDNTAYVFVKNGEEQEKRDVKLGTSDGTYIEITEGLSENEIVLYTPPITIDMDMLMGL
ncbi:MAG: HlyD family efflux transporter periplasmic adaptor subunit [Oscillospiraceae bacterium]|nr:HlyD family efflux transporter periplasmic adaptor subunit [Oscillospiraceae bacterium]